MVSRPPPSAEASRARAAARRACRRKTAYFSPDAQRRSSQLRPLIARSISNKASRRRTASRAIGELACPSCRREPLSRCRRVRRNPTAMFNSRPSGRREFPRQTLKSTIATDVLTLCFSKLRIGGHSKRTNAIPALYARLRRASQWRVRSARPCSRRCGQGSATRRKAYDRRRKFSAA